MECKGRRTMKRCVSLRGAHLHLHLLFLSPWLVHSWSVCWGGASPNITPDLWNSQGGKSSSGSSPHIKMAKQRKSPQKPRDEAKWEVGRRMRAVVDEGGNESQGCCAGPRWMVQRALSGISYRHTVNHSPHFFPVLRAVRRQTTKLQLWCFFLVGLKVSMFSDVLTQFYDSSAPWDLLK